MKNKLFAVLLALCLLLSLSACGVGTEETQAPTETATETMSPLIQPRTVDTVPSEEAPVDTIEPSDFPTQSNNG